MPFSKNLQLDAVIICIMMHSGALNMSVIMMNSPVVLLLCYFSLILSLF